MLPASRSALRRKHRRPRVLAWGVVLWVVVAVLCVEAPPRWWWPSLFGALTLPGALLANGLILTLAVLRRRWRAIVLPAIVALATWGYAGRGWALRWPPPDAPTPQQVGNDSTRLRVLSYNARVFNVYAHLATKDYSTSKTQIQWVADQPADVICLQEYYNQMPGFRPKPKVFDVTRRLKQGREAFVTVTLEKRAQQFGLAIFSRFPILKKGIISFGEQTQNHAAWADLKLPAGDTVRIYNVHFQSMALEESAIVRTTRRRAWLDPPGLSLLRRFRNGAVARSKQVDTVVAHISACPHPVVVCGDLNDLPYSYTYSALADDLVNAHQAVGGGIGSTYNGRLPLLRIDSQFSTPDRLQPLWVKVHDEVPYSDHFPLEAIYRVGPRP